MFKTFIISYSLCTIVFSQTYSGNRADIDQILENVKLFSSYIVNRNPQKIRDSYTDDAKILPTNLEILSGAEAIQSYWTPKGENTTVFHKITPHEIKIIGSEAYDYGEYEGKTKQANGAIVSWYGKYIVVWKKINNRWKIYLDIWNRTNRD